jgi:GT2 family glycosyltransferase
MQKLLSTVQEERASVSILILDNASTAESYAPLEVLDDRRVHLIKSERNLGFAGGVNYAYKYALENLLPFQYLFLFNPDAVSCPNLISDLIDVICQEPAAAGVSPKILYLNGMPWYAGAEINYKEGKVVNNAVLNPAEEKPYYEVDVFSGCAVLFDVSKISKAGALNENLFMYYDEADFSIKLQQQGYKILYVPQLVIYHDVSYTTRSISYLKTYYMTRNKFMVFGRSMNFSNKIYFLLHELAYHLKNRRFKNMQYHIKGYVDYKRRKVGQLTK